MQSLLKNKNSVDIEKFKKVAFNKRTHCVICGQKLSKSLIELPDFPMTEIYTTKKIEEKVGFVDQDFYFCEKCGQGQISNVIDIELQYDSTFSYNFRTSESSTARESSDFFVNFINSVAGKRNFKNIFEIGCNDLYLLKSLKSRAEKLVGIDPVLKGREEEFSEDNVIAIGDFFENVNIDDKIDLAICKDTLEHATDPKKLVIKIVEKADNETLFFFQFPILETIISGCRFDQIFHQHLNYFSLKSIIYMLDEIGCELIDYTINNNHWGAILIAFKKCIKNGQKYSNNVAEISSDEIVDSYKVFKNNMEITSKHLAFLKKEKIYGYGAALMLPVLSYHLKNDFSNFECIIDDDKNKEGLYYINLPVSIRAKEKVGNLKDSVVMVTAISSMSNVRHILAKLLDLNPKQIIVPLNTI